MRLSSFRAIEKFKPESGGVENVVKSVRLVNKGPDGGSPLHAHLDSYTVLINSPVYCQLSIRHDQLQWNMSVTTTSITKSIACDLFINVF